MKQKPSVNPRGWALLTLVAGVVLATPFLRPPRVDVDIDAKSRASRSPMSLATGLGRFAASSSTVQNPTNIGSSSRDSARDEFSDFSQLIIPPAAASPTQLPAWAPTHSPIDHLISQGTAPPWQSDSARVSTIKPLEPWIDEAGTRQHQPALPSTLARTWPDASSLPVADSDSALSRTPGSLAGTAQHLRPISQTPRLQSPAAQPPTQPQYVYQPGFQP